MAINRDGEYVEVHDTIVASDITEAAQVFYERDYFTVTSKINSGEAVMVRGTSYLTGESVSYVIPASTIIDLWRV